MLTVTTLLKQPSLASECLNALVFECAQVTQKSIKLTLIIQIIWFVLEEALSLIRK
jgi:hypothetical protein